MKKTSNRRERIKFICQKRGQRISDIFILMTDQEVKQYFDAVYLNRRDKPDATADDETVQCVRCGCDVEHHYECACGYDRVVFFRRRLGYTDRESAIEAWN